MLGYGLKHWETEGYVWDEDAVHYVEVEPVGFAAVDHFYVGLQIDEVGGQEAWGNEHKLFQCEVGLTYHLGVAEDEEFVCACFEVFGDVGIHGDFLFFACVFYEFLFGIFY